MSEKKIMVMADWYAPGYKAGGPIQSCVNFVRNMQTDYRLFVFTSDRDLGSAEAYKEVKVDQWVLTGENVHIYYCSPGELTWKNIRRQLEHVRPDFIYLNSMFSPKFTIYPLLISRLGKGSSRIVLAPRGMLKESAIRFKPLKKKIFLNLLKGFRMQKDIRFHASDETEVRDIRHYFGPAVSVSRIPNFPGGLSEQWHIPEKKAGELSLIFVGRIHPIKNLDYLLNVLKNVRPHVRLTIIGNLEDGLFWEGCQQIIEGLPGHITVQYAGEVPNDRLPSVTAAHHVFVLPTKGENFGHAIFEALALGKPVLISDQTPWRGLEAAGAGWDLPLDHPELFRNAIEQAAAFTGPEYENRCRSTRKYVSEYLEQLNLKEDYLKLFS